ncbi:hypothetical protein [Nocardiopsis potens]|uniref:hypothetical protein n=1 Tax=Nocardiopsis potens TaxID=1246458 RepID=UPI00036BC743|nr:hypothetical protein [Nocardiopsis potens]
MFQFARSSAKAVLVAAGAAGFVALGAGTAGAATAPSLTDPATDQVGAIAGEVVGTALDGRLPELPKLATTLPAPDTRNVAVPGGDVSHVGPQLHEGLTAVDGAVEDVRTATAPRTPQLSPAEVPQGGPAGDLAGVGPKAGEALRGTVKSAMDMVIYMEQDDPRKLLEDDGDKTERQAAEALPGAVAEPVSEVAPAPVTEALPEPVGTVDEAVRSTLPSTTAQLDRVAAEPPVSVDEDAVAQTAETLQDPLAVLPEPPTVPQSDGGALEDAGISVGGPLGTLL